ncbi:platelet glycoprotein 4-like isoform X2 [Clavelina lepadiformis]|uniref:platelet glycoprotein 4-like isoform X2 n=1 Tax=Clavelina lepadiformis TaxID=159417 RepID=UPI004042551C
MKNKKCCSTKCRLITAGIFGGVLVIVGGALMAIFDVLFESIIKKQTIVVPGTLMYDLNWKDVKTPVYRSFYLFNVTNKEEFLAQTPGKFVKPILQEIGPYTYREFLVKENVEYLDYNKTYPQQVYYKQSATFYFDPERSNGSKDDVLTTLNFIVPLIPALLENLIHNDGILKAAYVYLNKLIRETKTELLFTMSVDEYLFGFQNSLFDALIDIVAPDSGIDKFGLFLLTNMSIGWRDYQVYTGHNNHELTSVITKYKNMSELPYWNGTTCNMINGTDGTMTPPFLDKTKPIYFFVDEMCRSLYANFEEDYTVHNIKGWKYTVPAEVFQSPLKNTNNECFCLDPNHETCQHDGATLVGSCLFGVPLLVSFPHFLYGDGFYASKLVGMHPNKPDHEMALVFEPSVGVPLKVESRIQLNMYMTPNKEVKILSNINESFAFPMTWLNENAELQESDAVWLHKLLYKIDDIALLLQIVLLVIGGALLIGIFVYMVRKRYVSSNKSQDDQHSLPSSAKGSAKPDELPLEKAKADLFQQDFRYTSTSSTTEFIGT